VSEPGEEPPPLGSWRRLYGLLVLELAIVIVLCGALAAWRA